MTASHEVRFKLPNIEVAAKVWGDSQGIPVIALHGWLDNAATFDRIAPLMPGLHIVALDLPGHGLSDHLPVAGYSLWQQAATVLEVAESLGWQRFALMGHSMGAIISGLLAGSLPERIIGAGMIDGLLPVTAEADAAPAQMARYFAASLQAANKRKPVYDNPEKAIRARALGGNSPISHDAAAVLVERGLMPDHGGWTWRTDPQLFLPSPLRFTRQHALAFIEAIRSPACLVLANQGVIAKYPAVLEQVWQLEQIQVHAMDGGHHLHLEEQAPEVARILHTFFRELS